MGRESGKPILPDACPMVQYTAMDYSPTLYPGGRGGLQSTFNQRQNGTYCSSRSRHRLKKRGVDTRMPEGVEKSAKDWREPGFMPLLPASTSNLR